MCRGYVRQNTYPMLEVNSRIRSQFPLRSTMETNRKTGSDMVKSKLANASGGALLAGGITKGVEKAGQRLINSAASRQLAKSQNATIDESTQAAFDRTGLAAIPRRSFSRCALSDIPQLTAPICG